MVNKYNLLKEELSLHKFELSNLKNDMSINCSLQNEVIRVNLENESLKDEISDLKRVIKKWTCSKVTLDQLLFEQISGNIVNALRGKGRRKENNPSKEVLFTKADVSTSESAPMITSDSEDDMSQACSSKTPKQNVWYGQRKHYGMSNHLSDDCYSKPMCSTYGSISYTTKEHTEQTAVRKSLNKLKDQSTSKSTPIRNARMSKTFGEYSKEPGPKVVFRDDSSGDIEGYGLVNCNRITFTRVAYVNGLKHNLISISQLCDANFKVLFTKTQGTIFNQNDKVVLIAPRRRDVYIIDMSSFNKESNACFLAKASPRMENLNEVRVKEMRSDNGTEFRNHKLEEFCDEKGISQNFSSSCTPEQNGNSVTSEEPFEFTIADDLATLHEPDHAELADILESTEPQDNVLKRWSRDKYIELLNFIGEPLAGITTRSRIGDSDAASVHECLYVNFLFKYEPKKLIEALEEEGWVIAMQEELNQFERNKVWTLVPKPHGKTIIGTKWIWKNKMDEEGVVTKNKARLVAHGYNHQ
ncbi:retrovirus-related pol polyprotein from transposon TNT 1-94 [Tanacetum coccineum]